MSSRVARTTAWVLTAAYWVVLFIVTHIPAQRLPRVGVSDKAAHFVSYAMLAVGLYACFWLMRLSPTRTAIYVTLTLWIYGAVDEVLQIPVGRSCDIRDWFADASGTLLAVSVMTLFRALLHRQPAAPVAD